MPRRVRLHGGSRTLREGSERAMRDLPRRIYSKYTLRLGILRMVTILEAWEGGVGVGGLFYLFSF